MVIKTKLTPDQVALFEQHGSKVYNYFFLPFWIEDLGEGNYALHHLGKLPRELTSAIQSIREGKGYNSDKPNLDYCPTPNECVYPNCKCKLKSE
jgi:hypothetical protein